MLFLSKCVFSDVLSLFARLAKWLHETFCLALVASGRSNMPWIRKGFVSSGHHGGRRGRWQQYQKFLEMTFEAKAETPAFEAPSTASSDFKSDQVSSTDGSSTSGSSSEKGNEEKNEPDKDVSTNAGGSSTSGSSSENGNGKKLESDKVKAETPAETFEVWRTGRKMVWRKVKKAKAETPAFEAPSTASSDFKSDQVSSTDGGSPRIGSSSEQLADGSSTSGSSSENGNGKKLESDKDVSMGPTPTSAVHGLNLCNLTMSQQSIIHGQRRHTDAGELLLHLSCFISAFSLVACLDGNLIELQKVKKFQQNSFERSTRAGKLESKILQLSEMLEEFLYCEYLRQASEQRLLAELARMRAEQSCKPQARATEKLDMDSLPLKDRESQTGMCCYQEWSVLLRYSALEWLLLCAYSIACHRVQHAQQTRKACMARERSELETKESLAQAQIAKLQQQLAAERRRSEQLELAVRNKDLQLAEFQSAERAQRKGEVNETAKERPHGEEQIGSNGSGMPLEGSSASTSHDVLPKDPEQPREQAAGALSRTAENGTLEEEPKMEAVRKGRKLVNSKIRRKTKEELEKEQAEEEKDKKKKEEEDSQSADVEVACGQHAMIQPLQRNWRWFHEQREQRAYSAFLEFLLPCLCLHSLKVSQLEKESQEQRRRCRMLTAELENANNLHRTSLKSQQDVLEETVSRWKSFGIPECDVEVHVTDSGQFLPATYLPMTPRDSNNLKAKDRADSIKKKERLSDASATMRNASMGKRGRRKPISLFFQRKRTKRGQCIYQLKTEKPRQLKACSSSRQNELEIAEPEREASQLANESERQTSNTKIQCQSTEQRANVDAAAWKTAEERPETLICTAASDGRSGDVESLNKASSPASDMDTHSGAVASQTEATESNRFLQLITLQDASAENGSEFLPTELFPLLLDFLPVDEVVLFDVRAVSRFFASPKAWVFHLFKLVDIDSLPTLSSEKQMHPVVEYFHKGSETANAKLGIRERRSRMLRTSEGCRGFDLWIYNLHRWLLYQPDLVHHFIDVCLEVLDYQLGEPTANIFWWTATFLHRLYPWPELRMRIARRMLDIAGVAKEQKIVRPILNGLSQLAPACQCIDRHFLAEFVRIVTSDEALLSPCFCKVTEMADLVLADDLARLVAFRRHLSRAFLKPETLSEVRHELLELLAGWPASPS